MGLISCSLIVGIGVAEPCWGMHRRRRPDAGETGSGRPDPHSFGNPDQVRVQQLDLDLTVDFEHDVLKGIAILDIQRQPGCPADAPLVLDTRGLTIEEVGLRDAQVQRRAFVCADPFQLGPADPILGSKLTIELTHGDAGPDRVSDRAVGERLQWLEPSLTAGKKPSRSCSRSRRRSTHGRGFRFKIRREFGSLTTATIRVPPGLTAVMAAESRRQPRGASQGYFRFRACRSRSRLT